GYTGGAISVNLQTGAATLMNGNAAAGFSGIKRLVGSANAGDTLRAANTTNNWVITGLNAGTINSTALNFSAIEHLVGGTGLDTFKFSGTSSAVTTIDGGGAPFGQGDWLDYSAFTTSVVVNLATGAATNVSGGVTNIQNVISGSGADTLTGNSQGNILIAH